MTIEDDLNDSHVDVESAYAEFREAWHNGENPDPDIFCESYRECGSTLREMINHFLFVIEDFFASPTEVPQEGDDGLLEMVLGDFKVLREIGRGGMGVVYEAEQVSLNRKVALKVLSAHLSFSDEAVKKFRREAEAGGRQHHPGIVSIHAVGEEQGIHYIAQELVRGGKTLADRLESLGSMGDLPVGYFRKIAKLVAAIADALRHAHDTGVIHRDVKPSNILLTDRGSPMVTDFGLAKVEDALALSRTGDFAGTPYYMSPEQAVGSREKIDHRTDIFSLGVMLYEMMTLVRPFKGGTTQEVLRKIVSEEPRDPRKVSQRVPRDLAVICLKAMEKKKEHRYTNMGAMAEDLKRFIIGEQILARPAGTITKLGKRIKRNPTLSGALGVALLALVTLVILTPWYIVTLNKEKQKADEARNEAVAQRLAAQSSNVLSENPGLALLLGKNSTETYPSTMGNEALYEAILSSREIKTVFTGSVLSAVFSPDGKRFITASSDGAARIWDSQSGKMLVQLIPFGLSWPILHAAFSPDGTKAVTASFDKTVVVWNLSNHSKAVPFLTLKGHGNQVNWVEFSPDGSKIASASDDMTVRIWDALTGEELNLFIGHAWAVRSVSFSPDGKRVISASEDTTASIWDLATGERVGNALSHDHVVTFAEFGPKGEKILTCSGKTARIWNKRKDNCKSLKHEGVVTSASFDSSGKKVITATRDKTASIWDAASEEKRIILHGHEAGVRSAFFDPLSGERTLTAAADGTVRLWDVSDRSCQGPELLNAVLSSDAQYVVQVSKNRLNLELWETDPWRKIDELAVDDKVKRVYFSPDNSRLVVILSRNTHCIWNCTGDGGKVDLPLSGDFMAIAFTPDSQRMIITDTKKNVSSWDTVNLLNQYHSQSKEMIRFMKYDATGQKLLVVTEDGVVHFGEDELEQGLLPPPLEMEETIKSAVLSTDNKTVMTVSYSGILEGYAVHTRRKLPFSSNDCYFSEIEFSRDSSRIMALSVHGSPVIYDYVSGGEGSEISGYEGEIRIGRLSPDGRQAIFKSGDRTLIVWDIENKKVLANLKHKADITSIEYSGDGEWFFSATNKGQVFKWPIDPLMHARAIKPRELSGEEISYYKIESDDSVFEDNGGEQTKPILFEKDLDTLWQLGKAIVLSPRFNIREYQHALKLGNMALSLAPANLAFDYIRGLAYFRMGMFQEAGEILLKKKKPGVWDQHNLELGDEYEELLAEAKKVILTKTIRKAVSSFEHQATDRAISLLFLVEIEEGYQLWQFDSMMQEPYRKIYDYESSPLSSLACHPNQNTLAYIKTENESPAELMIQKVKIKDRVVGVGTPEMIGKSENNHICHLTWHPTKPTIYLCTKNSQVHRETISFIELNDSNDRSLQILIDRPEQAFGSPAISPDGKSIAFVHYPGMKDGFQMDLWIGKLGIFGLLRMDAVCPSRGLF